MNNKRIENKIILVGGLLMALRLIFPVMHGVVNKILEVCVSYFYPLSNKCVGLGENYIYDYDFSVDQTRTIFQAVAIFILTVTLLLFFKKKRIQNDKI